MSSANNDSIGVRVGVKSGGCAGMSYVMEYTNEINPNDEIIEDKGVKVLIDPKAIMYLIGTVMDYKEEKQINHIPFFEQIKLNSIQENREIEPDSEEEFLNKRETKS